MLEEGLGLDHPLSDNTFRNVKSFEIIPLNFVLKSDHINLDSFQIRSIRVARLLYPIKNILLGRRYVDP